MSSENAEMTAVNTDITTMGSVGSDTASKVAHPAKYSRSVLAHIDKIIRAEQAYFYPNLLVLDPFAGIGGIHELADDDVTTFGVELEPEWAACHPRTQVGNALALPFADESIDVVATSPTYGNRMADKHTPKEDSFRVSYTHTLGRKLTDGNSGAMQWGRDYRGFHIQAWREVHRVLKPEGLFILNISDHIRARKIIDVTGWHVAVIKRIGFRLLHTTEVETRRMRRGANNERVGYESVIAFRKTSRNCSEIPNNSREEM